MSTWNPAQYLKFEEERTQPCRDLVARIAVPDPGKIIDLGCGTGNSTAVLAAHWSRAQITGLDNSHAMIDAARKANPQGQWLVDDIAGWASRGGEKFDVVFANAAMQWVPGHAAVYPQLLGRVAEGGALAVQVPCNIDAPAHRLMRELAVSPAWKDRFPADGVREWHVHDLSFYYNTLAPLARRVDIWQTEYTHVLDATYEVVEWYKGSGLRPFLDALKTDADRQKFIGDYRALIRDEYRPQPDGKVLFPFQRLFVVAYN